MALLEVEGITKSFRQRRGMRRDTEHVVVDDVSFTVAASRTVAIVGESGAGKSTTARIVLRLIEPNRGSVRFAGVEVLSLPREQLRRLRRDMQMIFQDPQGSLDPRVAVGRSVAEPMKVHLGISRSEREAKATELLDRVGIGTHLHGRYPRELSGGQLQRVAIARALALGPKLIVCDEAVASLDVSVRAGVLNLLSDLQNELGIAYLFISHDLAVVERFADEIVVMQAGKVVEQGATADVFACPNASYTKQLLDAIPLAGRGRRPPPAQTG